MKKIQNKNPLANQNRMKIDKSDPNTKLTIKIDFRGS